ncbi:MAG: hypothetical protein HYX32_14660 [Actinobacteria bacterium]|nr:hypothetical protein [Actinomycetota bacterium]
MPTTLDLADFDAMGVATELVVALRSHAIRHGADTVATVDAPPGWHRLRVTARRSGHIVLSIRYDDLTRSRLHNVAGALEERGWQLDEDANGATRRYLPGTEATDAAFELLAVVPLAGSPIGTRSVTARDATGNEVALS